MIACAKSCVVDLALLNLAIITMQRVPFLFGAKMRAFLIEVAGGKKAGKGKYAISYICE